MLTSLCYYRLQKVTYINYKEVLNFLILLDSIPCFSDVEPDPHGSASN